MVSPPIPQCYPMALTSPRQVLFKRKPVQYLSRPEIENEDTEVRIPMH